MKIKITIKINEEEIFDEIEIKNKKELRTQLNRLFRKLKKRLGDK